MFVSEDVLDETERNLALKHPAGLAVVAELRDAYEYQMAEPSPELIQEASEIIEPKDAPILAGALAAHAEYLVTHDKRHLLSQAGTIKSHFGISVTTPGDLLDLLRG